MSSLTTAVNQANASAGADTVQLGHGCTYTLTAPASHWYGPDGLPPISSEITIQGNGATIARSQASGTPKFRLLFVDADSQKPNTQNYISPGPGVLTLRDVTLTGGFAKGGDSNRGGGGAGLGGAIFNQGSVTIERSTLAGNEAFGGSAINSSAGGGGGGIGADAPGGSGDGGGFTAGVFGFGGSGGPGHSGDGGGGGAGIAYGEDGQPATASGPGAGGGPRTGLGGAAGGSSGDGSGGGGGAAACSDYAGGSFGSGGLGGGASPSGGQACAGGGGGVGGGGGNGYAPAGGGGFGGGGGAGTTGGGGGFGGGGGAAFTGTAGAPGFGGGVPSGQLGGGGAGMGGAIFNMQGSLTIVNSTVANNFAVGGADVVADHGKGIAGAVFNLNGTFSSRDSTFANNSGTYYATQIYDLEYDGYQVRHASTVLRNTIVANGYGSAPDLTADRDNYNIITPAGSTASADVSQFDLLTMPPATRQQGTVSGSPLIADPMLGKLQDNGGLTQTMALAPGSVAIDRGNSFGVTNDQRGDPRPSDFAGFVNATGGDGSDIGAFELQKVCTDQVTPALACKLSITAVRQSASRWRSSNQLPHISSAPVGTAFSFTLNERTTTALVFARLLSGRKVHGKCVAPTSKNNHEPRCTRHIPAGALRFSAHPGINTVRFYGRVSRTRKLQPGRYALAITATNGAGQRARARTLSFTIVK